MPRFGLDLLRFSKLVLHAPRLLSSLMTSVGASATLEVVEKVKLFCRHVTEEDSNYYRREHTIAPDRLALLTELSRLGVSHAGLPLDLYREYCDRLMAGYEKGEGPRLSEEELIFVLTDGRFPVTDYFRVGEDHFMYWDTREKHATYWLIRDNQGYLDCQEYLKSLKLRAFSCEEEVIRIAAQENW